MFDLAKSITWRKAREWGSTPEQCTDACLKAMANFAFATARPAQLVHELYEWLRTWGITSDEYDVYVARILGSLLLPSNEGKAWDALSVMRRIFDSPDAIPITPSYVWPAVIRDLYERRWSDLPTRRLITQRGPVDWLLDRSTLLCGLPGAFTKGSNFSVNEEDRYFSSTKGPPQIFAIVGPGGVGKSSLLAQLLAEIGGGVWDWRTSRFRHDPKFVGYPIALEADENAIQEIEGALRKWGGRNVAVDQTVERFAAANKVTGSDPAVWLALDGIDEVPDQNLRQMARKMVNYVSSHPNLRLVLTSRPEQLESMTSILNSKGLLHSLIVGEFDIDEAQEAVRRATNGELLMRSLNANVSQVGEMNDNTRRFHDTGSKEFETSIRQPLFVGVIRRVYERRDGIAMIQAAYDDDPVALSGLATEYVHVFCDRVHRRLNRSAITKRMIFASLKQLAADVSNPPGANPADWVKVCEAQLNDLVPWGILHAQCAASGLIRNLGSGAFEWRHPFVGRCLPNMEGSAAWQ